MDATIDIPPDTRDGLNLCVVEASPAEVEAGARLTLSGRLTCDPPRDLDGAHLRVEDAEGVEVASLPFTGLDGDTATTDPVVVAAPPDPGDHQWRAFLVAPETAGEAGPEAEAGTVAFTVRPQATRLVVWDVPPTVVAGEAFTIKVGAKPSVPGSLAGTGITVLGPDGGVRGTATLAEAVWPGSEGLEFVEVALTAPDAEGAEQWTATVAAAADGPARNEGSARFGLRFVPAPDCGLTIEAFDAEAKTPLAGAKIVMHPYRARTDAEGRVTLRVARGSYKLFVSAANHFPVTREIEIDGDVETRAELTAEPPELLERGYL
jgi:hypothetical protein